jgi:hypothetical protein
MNVREHLTALDLENQHVRVCLTDREAEVVRVCKANQEVRCDVSERVSGV